MDSLPPEILCDIFLGTFPYNHDAYLFPFSESISCPLRVSHVCRSWRELALSIRKLWSYLGIDVWDFSGRKGRKTLVEIFDTWLARTNDGPINFTIYCSCLSYSEATIQDHECAEYIFTTLVENQHRWEDVHFYCYSVGFSPRFPGFKLTDMPILTSLDLSLHHSLHAMVNLARSPRLRHLFIYLGNLDLVAGSRLPHLEVVVLQLPSHERIISPQSNRSVLSCLELLRNAPSLLCVFFAPRIVGYQIVGQLSPSPWDGERILLSGLYELKLGACRGIISTIVDTLTLPSLERLVFFSEVGIENLLPLFQRSEPPLAHLELKCRNLHEKNLIDILRILSKLQYLQLYHAELSHRFFHELTVLDGTHGCTLAAEIAIGNERVELEPLLTMAKSRAFILGTFRTVTIYPKILEMAEMTLPEANERTVAIADIDACADEIKLSRSITFESLQGLDDS